MKKMAYGLVILLLLQLALIPGIAGADSDSREYAPILNIDNNGTIKGVAGERLSLRLTIKNTSDFSAKKIRITPELSADGPFTLDSGGAFQLLERLDYGDSQVVNFNLKISPLAEEKVYALKFNFQYDNDWDDHFGSKDSPETDTVYISVTNYNVLPSLEIKDISYSRPYEDQPRVMEAAISLRNLGNLQARDVKVTLQGLKDDGIGLYQDSNFKSIDRIGGTAEAVVTYRLLPANKISHGNYGLTAKVEYRDQSGKEYSTEHHFFVPVDGGGAGGGTVPKVILSRYNSEPSIVKAGENFSLNLTFLNTSHTKTVRNIKIFFTVPAGESTGTGTSTSSGSVFTPVNSSNTIFVDSIAPNGSYQKTMEFYTIPDAAPKTYTMTANFEYEDDAGVEYETTEIIGVPVNQQIKLQTSEIQLPPEVFSGQPVPISLEFYNTGKAKISNLMLKLEGDFGTENGAYYVGSFDVGASDYYEGTIIPAAPGLQKGVLLISFEEPSGEQREIRNEFTLNVMEMPPMEMPPGFDYPGMQQKPPGANRTWIWIGAGVLALAVVGFIVYKTKILTKLVNSKRGQTLDE